MEIREILRKGLEINCSDIFLIPGSVPSFKKGNQIIPMEDYERVTATGSSELINQVYRMADRDKKQLVQTGDDDFSFSIIGKSRFRCNAYKQRNSFALVIRIIAFGLPDRKEMNIPDDVMDVVNVNNGLVLVTGPAGSGKSTTLACLIDKLNSEREGHIITIEDPIEFMHRHNKCLVSQREVEHDTQNYNTALKAALRQTPNIILVGELNSYDTIETALSAAETGQLLLSSLHTTGAVNTIERLLNVFPSTQQTQVRLQLSMVLKGIVSQQLLMTRSGQLTPVFEVTRITPSIQHMIREGQELNVEDGIIRHMDDDILKLYKNEIIDRETAINYSLDSYNMNKMLG